MPHGGLALANSLATALEMTALLVLMRRRLHGLEGGRITRGLLQAAAATLGMSAAIWLWSRVVGAAWLQGLGGVALGALIYFAMIWALRVPELNLLITGITRRLKRLA
jgi:putative peptidoglycan lipid II flippase